MRPDISFGGNQPKTFITPKQASPILLDKESTEQKIEANYQANTNFHMQNKPYQYYQMYQTPQKQYFTVTK